MSAILSEREKKQWEKIKVLAQNNNYFDLDDADAIRMKRVLDLLQAQGYIENLDVDGTNMFSVLGNLHDFDEWLKDEEKEFLLKEQHQRQRHCQELRQLRVSSIVNSQPIINGVHIMDAASEKFFIIFCPFTMGMPTELSSAIVPSSPPAIEMILWQLSRKWKSF